MPSLLVLVVCVLCAALAAPAAYGAAIDPERNSTTPTAWSWQLKRSEDQINAIRKQGMRLVDLEVESFSPPRFSVAFVANKGEFARSKAGWYYGLSAKGVTKITDAGRRIIDLETSTVNGKRVFSIVTLRNAGEAGKEWYWNHDRSTAQVTADINKHGIRLTDLNAYTVGGKQRFSYVGVKDAGVDKRAWWWYPEVTAASLQQKAAANGARIIDVERTGLATFAAVMVESKGEYSVLETGRTASALGKLVASKGVRVAELERVPGGYAAVLINSVDAETARVRAFLDRSPWAGTFSGAYAKPLGGAPTVTLADTARYQPWSTMKLVPFVYAMSRVDAKSLYLDGTTISFQRPPGKPDDPCPAVNGPNETFTSVLRTTLQRAMRESLNRAHETLLEEYTPEAIVDFVRGDAVGMTHTQMYHGCKVKDKKFWEESYTTLQDMGLLFERVESGKPFANDPAGTRKTFYELMDDPDETVWFRTVVSEEAAKLGKSDKVAAFLAQIDLRGKGGGLNNGGGTKWKMGRGYAYRLRLPFLDAAGTIQHRGFVGGFFATDIVGPCYEEQSLEPSASAECMAYGARMRATFEGLPAELHRPDIARALKTF